MGQGLFQTQAQTQAQLQKLSPQQLMLVKLLELPVTELEQRINIEMDDNPALESNGPAEDNGMDYGETSADEGYDAESPETIEKEDRQAALDDALRNMGGDDELPTFPTGNYTQSDNEEFVYGNIDSFYDKLMEQLGEHDLTDQQKDIIEYIIGSLDDDGLLRKSLSDISDELAVNYNIYASETELGEMLRVLQSFDPPGIGARSLQECLLIQIERKEEEKGETTLTKAMKTVVSDYFEEFTKKHWNKIQQQSEMSDSLIEETKKELLKLNPKPGASMGESVGRNLQSITPDFIVDTDDDGTVTFYINDSRIPELHVSPSFTDMMKEYQNGKEKMSRQMKEALLYTKKKVDAAQNFIEAVKQRHLTLASTMKAIIQRQHQFFEDGDEASLKPMILKDIADATGLDISTISRVSNSKYVQTRWGIFPLKFFFNDSFKTEQGEELSVRKIKVALKEIIDNEDKQNPFNDEVLKEMLAKKGFPIARRTVAKYREQMGIPIARLRK